MKSCDDIDWDLDCPELVGIPYDCNTKSILPERRSTSTTERYFKADSLHSAVATNNIIKIENLIRQRNEIEAKVIKYLMTSNISHLNLQSRII
jgi:hypothetical protein